MCEERLDRIEDMLTRLIGMVGRSISTAPDALHDYPV
ncbi:Uncharacterised protein [Paenibacillus macerans]|nr:Uncharacterised protein [Paenibacillus macerans]